MRRVPTMPVQQRQGGHAPSQMATPPRTPPQQQAYQQPQRLVQSTTLTKRTAVRRTV